MDHPVTSDAAEGKRRATLRCRTASLTATAGRGAPAHRGGRTGEGAP
ncbi:DUF6380 family protein [Streptomyces anandii]|uniref:DUF6380 family protein n=1 Tax=Streptomyces anandii TaxID=285454 RepID=A0ABW6HF52_9ACTN|nr:DUF6380 family protein [Streptomyces anandii]